MIFVLIFFTLLQTDTHIELNAWKLPYEFATREDCDEAGAAFVKNSPKVSFHCTPFKPTR